MSCAGASTAPAAAAPASACRRRRASSTVPGCRRSPIGRAPGRRSRSRCWRACRAPTIRRSQPLKTRDDDDFSIALSRRHARSCSTSSPSTRSGWRTRATCAPQRSSHSLTELARLIGYQPAPGRRRHRPTSPSPQGGDRALPTDPTTTADHHPAGNAGAERAGRRAVAADVRDFRRHSGQARLERAAGADRRAVGAAGRRYERLSRRHGDAVAAGRRILVVGDERRRDPARATDWDVRLVTSVDGRHRPRTARWSTWTEGLGAAARRAALRENPKFYALRQRASLFGYNASIRRCCYTKNRTQSRPA